MLNVTTVRKQISRVVFKLTVKLRQKDPSVRSRRNRTDNGPTVLHPRMSPVAGGVTATAADTSTVRSDEQM